MQPSRFAVGLYSSNKKKLFLHFGVCLLGVRAQWHSGYRNLTVTEIYKAEKNFQSRGHKVTPQNNSEGILEGGTEIIKRYDQTSGVGDVLKR